MDFLFWLNSHFIMLKVIDNLQIGECKEYNYVTLKKSFQFKEKGNSSWSRMYNVRMRLIRLFCWHYGLLLPKCDKLLFPCSILSLSKGI